MSQEPFVSVCIQTYQHKDFIAECIESAVRQKTSFPFEIIIGEDDSTDGTRKICQHYAAKYPELIKLFLRSEKDKIYVYGQKTGRHNYIENLKTAKGKYIALLDGDDYWIDDTKLQKQADFMEANPGCSLSYHKILYRDNFKTPEEKPATFWQDPNIREKRTFKKCHHGFMKCQFLIFHFSYIMH
jgi:glycosyltransferase involved in cell wall biosynthesis